MIKRSFYIAIIYYAFICMELLEARPQHNRFFQAMHNDAPQCGYQSCHKIKPNMLNVHLVPHTHDDVGWLKTVDQYYYGSETLIQKAGVQYIIDSVIDELLKDPNKRFIYVESAFFFKWWDEQTPDRQQKVKMLVNEGRLEFIGGAWSMNDEATTHYQSVIDQFTWGLRRLNDTFGECGRPRVGWQIDPFGHSREMASMFAQMGFDGLFFGRLDYQDKDARLMSKTAEMIWRASANLGESAHLFTGALFNNYQAPPGFCFDILCADDPIIDGKHSPDNNVKKKVDDFFAFVRNMSISYRSNNVLITMGEDFNYQVANLWYKNMDKLIKYANERQANGSNINLLYSTPSCYLLALQQARLTWPTKDDDFFPYASDPHAYWTGYFTSRPTLKRFERVGNHFLQVCKQLTTMAPRESPEFRPHLTFLRETMGIMQHHDAVTGTEKQKVAYDYAKRLEVGIRACNANTKDILNRLTTGEGAKQIPADENDKEHFLFRKQYKFEFKTCTLQNISQCDISENNKKFILTLYNPLAHATTEYIRAPVSYWSYDVYDYKGVEIETQIIPIPETVRNLTYRTSPADYELIFEATEVPPFGYKSYFIQKSHKRRLKPVPDAPNTSSPTIIGNKKFQLIFDTNGFLSAVSVDDMTRIVNQEFLYYEGAIGNNREFNNRSSGAYIFRPKTDTVSSVTMSPNIIVYRGNLVDEIQQTFNEWISQVVRVYHNQKHAEFEWLVGPIPIDDDKGKEIISRFNSDIQSEGIFYTDSNGREMIKRLRDHRDTWRVKLAERTAGNYYPVTTKIALEDENARMAILTDRAQGGSSMGDGSLELMIHRRLLHDDAFGVGESLNETAYGDGLIARGKHYLIMGTSQLDHSPTTQLYERYTQLQTLLPTWKFYSDATDLVVDDWKTNYTNIFTGLSLSLPKNINLMSFEPWHDNEILIRFEHILEKDEDPDNAQFVQFNLKDILQGFDIRDIRETTLSGNAWLYDIRRMQFVTDPDDYDYDYNTYGIYAKSAEIVQLQRADKPMLETKYSNETISSDSLGAQSNRNRNRIKRHLKNHLNLNRLRSEALNKINIDISHLALENDNNRKYTIELSPMQIRTFILYLNKHI